MSGTLWLHVSILRPRIELSRWRRLWLTLRRDKHKTTVIWRGMVAADETITVPFPASIAFDGGRRAISGFKFEPRIHEVDTREMRAGFREAEEHFRGN